MLRFLVSLALAALLVGCLSNNSGPQSLQYSAEPMTFPYSYQVEAARIVEERDADPGFARVSRPQTTMGDTVFAPRRWFACIRGIPAPAPPSGLLAAISQLFRTWFGPRDVDGIVYDVVLYFGGDERPQIRDGFDLPLCRNLEFEFIVAEPAGGLVR